MQKLTKQQRIAKLRSKADTVFSKFIRLRDKNKCFLENSTSNKECHGAPNNGHMFKRGKHSLRYDEYNCNCLCSYHNFLDNTEHDHYVMAFIRKYGKRLYEKLYEISNIRIELTEQYYTKIIQKYTKKLKELEECDDIKLNIKDLKNANL